MSEEVKENPLDDFLPSTTSNVIVNIESIRTKRNLELQNKQGYFIQQFYVEDMFDGKEYNKLIKSIERQVRTSDEYKRYIGYLRGEIGLNRCSILGEISDEVASIEMHHYPFTLFDIVNIVVAHKLEKKQRVNTFLVADEILKIHFDNIIGLVPLSVTVHELVHAGEIFVNLNQVFGDVNTFIETYYMGITDEHIDSLNSLVKLSEMNISYSETDVLMKKRSSWSNLEEGQKKLNYEDF
jgi:hypothetical protein